jgi:mannose-6-phosphate isomerase
VRVLSAGGDFISEVRAVLELSERYPGDAGVLAALLLNRVTLAPGEALFLPAGNLHTYLSGAGIELMANSDNVLRGGLTPKHVDVPELLRVLDFTAAPPPVLRGRPDGPWTRYGTPAQEFLLRRFEGGSPAAPPVPVPDGGPRILLCTDGGACVSSAAEEVKVRRGGALWLPACDVGVTLRPDTEGTQVFLAGDGLDGTPG